MVHIEKITSKSFLCCQCAKTATVRINDMKYCTGCGDDILIRTIVKCSKNLQQVSMNLQLKVIPTGLKRKPKNG